MARKRLIRVDDFAPEPVALTVGDSPESIREKLKGAVLIAKRKRPGIASARPDVGGGDGRGLSIGPSGVIVHPRAGSSAAAEPLPRRRRRPADAGRAGPGLSLGRRRRRRCRGRAAPLPRSRAGRAWALRRSGASRRWAYKVARSGLIARFACSRRSTRRSLCDGLLASPRISRSSAEGLPWAR